MDERKLILRIAKILPDEIILMSEAERLDLIMDFPVREGEQLIKLCARIITTAADGKRIKLEQLQERYADDLIN